MSPERWLAFVGVLLVVLITPGPDFLVVFRHSLNGAWAGYRAVAGIITGLSLHTLIAAVGVAAVVAAHPPVFQGVRLAGAGYLTWLGVTSLRAFMSRRRTHPPSGPAEPGGPAGPSHVEEGRDRAVDAPVGHPYRDGLLTNVLNPKAILFFIGLLPQFINPDGCVVVVQTLLLAATTIVLAGLWWTLLIYMIARTLGLLTRPPVRRAIDGMAAAAFFGLAVSIAW